MLNSALSWINDFADGKSVLIDTTWNTFRDRPLLWNQGKIIAFLKQKANAILTEEQARKWYYCSGDKWIVKFDIEQAGQNIDFNFINRKREVIDNNVRNLINIIQNAWWISEDSLDYELLQVYIEKWYISIEEIKQALLEFFTTEARKICNKASTLYKVSGYQWDPVVAQAYHDLYRDFLQEKQEILAYCMKQNLLNSFELNELEQILKKWWDSLEFFYSSFYKEDLLVWYLKKMWIWEKNT